MSNAPHTDLIFPNWPVPANIRACATTRLGGFSAGPYASLNLGDHVGDDPAQVDSNREHLAQLAELPEQPRWLNQVHGPAGVHADTIDATPSADWSWTASSGVVCAVMTADCLPVLLCDRAGRQVAAVHAGWPGPRSAVLEPPVQQFLSADIAADKIMVWFGPAIGADAYEVDRPVKKAFAGRSPDCASAFHANRQGRWQFDIYAAAREILLSMGVQAFYGGHFCTYSSSGFFSHRREAPCGRQASMIWMQD